MHLNEYLETTTQAAFGTRCGVSQSAVSQWAKNGVPFDKVRVVFEASDGKVTPHDCFPDIFPAGFAFPAGSAGETEIAAPASVLGAFFAGLGADERVAFEQEITAARAQGRTGEDLIAEIYAISVRRGASFSLEDLLTEYHAGRWQALAARAALTWLPAELRLLPGPREVRDRQFVKSRSKDLEAAGLAQDPLGNGAPA